MHPDLFSTRLLRTTSGTIGYQSLAPLVLILGRTQKEEIFVRVQVYCIGKVCSFLKFGQRLITNRKESKVVQDFDTQQYVLHVSETWQESLFQTLKVLSSPVELMAMQVDFDSFASETAGCPNPAPIVLVA